MSLNILMGDCRESMRTLDARSVQCCVTSPPYWALRDYGVQPTLWEAMEFVPMAGLPPVQIPAMECCLGLEDDPLAFVGHMVLVFREVWRVLRDDGVLWMNFGDSAAPSGSLKPKDIMGMPWRVALALQADGWTLRQDNIWNKPNPMPESAKDRCTKAHEYIFLLSKSARYYWDHEAMREPVSGTAHPRGRGVNPKAKWKTPDGWDTSTGDGGHGSIHRKGREKGKRQVKQNESFSDAVKGLVTTRNKRSVWTVNPQPYPEAHFATFPEALVLPCILAGTSAKGCCPECGAPWERVVVKGEVDKEHQRACGGDENGEYHGKATKDYGKARAEDPSAVKARILAGMRERKTVGWEPTCDCGEHDPIPCTVLDPFGGSGTTGRVALEEGRSVVLCELNPEYKPLIQRRCMVTPKFQFC
ncbi:DNA-methyltransferase [Cerasicoccus frondis]|uniref:DNA-methyltransferase n=1 Tax=Cerasicoccus frondis TaxID=490090 RepID=UPI0028527FFA|nr:site-specific DNA-methyltransferase [Cerasicoccus frondis]